MISKVNAPPENSFFIDLITITGEKASAARAADASAHDRPPGINAA
jgi:hypothetical protein